MGRLRMTPHRWHTLPWEQCAIWHTLPWEKRAIRHTRPGERCATFYFTITLTVTVLEPDL